MINEIESLSQQHRYKIASLVNNIFFKKMYPVEQIISAMFSSKESSEYASIFSEENIALLASARKLLSDSDYHDLSNGAKEVYILLEEKKRIHNHSIS
jgi:hypothetical protein